MGGVNPVKQVKLFCGIIGRNREIIARSRAELIPLLGDIDHESEEMPFDFTNYYTPEMGSGLLRQFVSFKKPGDPRQLAGIKLATNDIEDKFAVTVDGKTIRTVNIDPGYITAANLILATTKDFAHRICIGDGIYAEVTLIFRKSGLVFFDWTYPDFKSGKYTPFFIETRRRYMEEVPQSART